MHVLFAYAHNCPGMTGNGRQQTRHCAYIAIVLYSRLKLLSRLVSDTRSVQMLCMGYVFCRALVSFCANCGKKDYPGVTFFAMSGTYQVHVYQKHYFIHVCIILPENFSV